MEQKKFFTDLFDYNHYYNQIFIRMLNEMQNNATPRCIELLNHTINAHQVWNARMLEQIPFGIWQINSSTHLSKLDEANFQNSVNIADNANYSETVTYQNSKGESFRNTIADILFHIINHSTYHRGQINLELKKMGIEPIITDYIFYKR